VEVQLHTFLTSVLDGSELSALCPDHFTPQERAPDTYWTVGWVGPRAGLGVIPLLVLEPQSSSL